MKIYYVRKERVLVFIQHLPCNVLDFEKNLIQAIQGN